MILHTLAQLCSLELNGRCNSCVNRACCSFEGESSLRSGLLWLSQTSVAGTEVSLDFWHRGRSVQFARFPAD